MIKRKRRFLCRHDENDPNPSARRPPSGEFDVPLVFHDVRFDSGGYRFFDALEPNGVLGDQYCVNGTVQPYFQVARRKYRFRMLNGSVARIYRFNLVNGSVNEAVATSPTTAICCLPR